MKVLSESRSREDIKLLTLRIHYFRRYKDYGDAATSTPHLILPSQQQLSDNRTQLKIAQPCETSQLGV